MNSVQSGDVNIGHHRLERALFEAFSVAKSRGIELISEKYPHDGNPAMFSGASVRVAWIGVICSHKQEGFSASVRSWDDPTKG